MAIPKQTSTWDEHRNSSRVFPVPPDALPNAMRALAILRRDHPDLVRWLLDGHPTMTEDEHLQRFGVHYQGFGARKRRQPRASVSA